MVCTYRRASREDAATVRTGWFRTVRPILPLVRWQVATSYSLPSPCGVLPFTFTPSETYSFYVRLAHSWLVNPDRSIRQPLPHACRARPSLFTLPSSLVLPAFSRALPGIRSFPTLSSVPSNTPPNLTFGLSSSARPLALSEDSRDRFDAAMRENRWLTTCGAPARVRNSPP